MEQCDDGNTINTDGGDACMLIHTRVQLLYQHLRCGDGFVQAGEVGDAGTEILVITAIGLHWHWMIFLFTKLCHNLSLIIILSDNE